MLSMGKNGRLGNQLFQIASTMAIAMRNDMDYAFPKWEYADYFKKPLPEIPAGTSFKEFAEPQFHYRDYQFDGSENISLRGYFQSEKFWREYEDKIIEQFTFKDEYIQSLELPERISQGCFVSIRRGDFVGNNNYAQIGMDYFERAMTYMSTDRDIHEFYIFSDDVAWCRENMPQKNFRSYVFMDNYTFLPGLAAMSRCKAGIASNSTYSWWGAWLMEAFHEHGETFVFCPDLNFGPGQLSQIDDKDYYPRRWTVVPVKDIQRPVVKKKIDLSDVTFTIPIRLDHPDRLENLKLCIEFLQYYFKTNIVIGEENWNSQLSYRNYQGCKLKFYKSPTRSSIFRRTWLLNQLAHEVKTPYFFNWDCDVFMKPEQILACVEQLRSGKADGCYPYDGKFLRANRRFYLKRFRDCLNTELFKGDMFPEYQFKQESYGGAIGWNAAKYWQGGGENENIIGYGPEDFERVERFRKLGYKINRTPGVLIHMDHATAQNGSAGHQYTDHNTRVLEGVRQKPYVPEERPLSPVYSLGFDECYMVNLDKRKDRLKYFTETALKHGLDAWARWPAIDGKKDNMKIPGIMRLNPGMVGCFESHKALLKHAMDHNYESILVMEDDIKPRAGFNYLLELALPSVPADWEFIYFGYEEYGGFGDFKDQVNEYWVVPKSVWGTQCYAVRGAGLQKVYDMLEKQIMQLDEQFAFKFPKSDLKYYCIWPCAVQQEFDRLPSDIQNRGRMPI